MTRRIAPDSRARSSTPLCNSRGIAMGAGANYTTAFAARIITAHESTINVNVTGFRQEPYLRISHHLSPSLFTPRFRPAIQHALVRLATKLDGQYQ